jgi:hypothetical protein
MFFYLGVWGWEGFGLGTFFSPMSASFAYDDMFLRQQTQAGLNTGQNVREVFKDMGRGMWKSGKGFGKVGALFAGIECDIGGLPPFPLFLLSSNFFHVALGPRNDAINSAASGFVAGASWHVIWVRGRRLVVYWRLLYFLSPSICSSGERRVCIFFLRSRFYGCLRFYVW